VRWSCVALALLAMSFLPPSSLARSNGSQTAPVDQNYVSALATADRFLHAWQTQDEESGILMLTDRARQHTSEEALQGFFTSGVVTRDGFEIGRGRKLRLNCYEFPVALFQKSSPHHKWVQPQSSTLVVVKSGSEWAIDRLP
jgi:hypothetical protein